LLKLLFVIGYTVTGLVLPSAHQAIVFSVDHVVTAMLYLFSERTTEASLEESVGEVGFRERAEIVIERGLVGFLGTKSVGFSGDQF
jgi:hypothetical protein